MSDLVHVLAAWCMHLEARAEIHLVDVSLNKSHKDVNANDLFDGVPASSPR